MGSLSDRLSHADTRWKAVMDALLTAASHTMVVHYRTVISQGSSTNYDNFFGEAIDGRDPTGHTGTSSSTPAPVTVTGMAHTDLVGTTISEREAIQMLPAGYFQPGDVIFECKRSTYAATTFVNVDYVLYDSEKYRIYGVYKRGLLTQDYIWQLFLRRVGK